MSIKPGSNDIPTVIRGTSVRTTCFLKACMLSALFLPVLLASQPAKDVEVVNDTVGDMQVVVAGSSGLNFGVVYNRELVYCTVLDFEAVQNKLPVAMRDNEGNEWDVFGTAVSGARTGQQLQKTNSYVSYWFAWTAFFSGKAPDYFVVDIHQ
jgi:hypothetical protein